MNGFSLVVEGPPPRKNERHRLVAPRKGRAMLVNSAKFESFVLRLTNRWRREGSPKIRAGAWAIRVVNYWPRKRKLDVVVPFGDVDASISTILDALQECGAVDDDVRFIEAEMRNGYDKTEPRVEITVERAPVTC